MLVRELMKSFLRIDCKKTISEAANLMEKAHTGCALVERNEKPIGVVTERDFLKKVVATGLVPTRKTVEEIMSSPIITISQDEAVLKASEIMAKKNIRRLAVVNEKGEIIGKITTSAICKNISFFRVRQMNDARKEEGSAFT